MRIAVKYCGGCNPHFQRSAVVEKLRRDFPGIAIAAAGQTETPSDLTLVVCGCPSACASRDGLESVHGTMLIAAEADYEKTAARVKTILATWSSP